MHYKKENYKYIYADMHALYKKKTVFNVKMDLPIPTNTILHLFCLSYPLPSL